MALPNAALPYGFVYVYGKGTDIGIQGNQAINIAYKFATIYGVGVNMSSGIVGNSVCFLATPEPPGLMGAGYPYLILKYDAIIATEEAP